VTGVATGTATITATSEGKTDNAAIEVSALPVGSVTISPGSVSLIVGQTSRLTATVRDAGGKVLSGRPVDWSSSNEDIATVSSSGLVTGRAEGSAQITATSEGKHATISVTVAAVPANAVIVSPKSATVVVGATRQLSAQVTDADGNPLSGRPISWSSSNDGIATVSGSGLVTGKAEGKATITATSEGKSGKATITVEPVPVASVDVEPDAATLTVGDTKQFTATPKDANGKVLSGREVTWSSNHTDVATVSASGLVRAVGSGSAVISAKSEGQTGIATVTVGSVPVASVDVSPSSATLVIGDTKQLTATPKDAQGNTLSGRGVQWFSDNTPVASVSSTGVVTARAEGTATISATSEGKTGTATITVTKAAVASVTVSPASASVQVGKSTTLTATVKAADGSTLTDRPVTWKSSDDDVASVDGRGVVTGVRPGSATITATSGGKSGSSAITVTAVPVASVAVTPGADTIVAGATTQLTATVKDADGKTVTDRTVTWSSSDDRIATVGTTGVVTGVAEGKVTITATSEGKSGKATIVVQPVPVASVDVGPPNPSVEAGSTVQLTATPRDANGNALDGRAVSWSSGDPKIATVDNNGRVTGVAEGSVTITATSEGKSGGVTVKVMPPPVSSVTVNPPLIDALPVGTSDQFTAVLRDAQGNVLEGREIKWTSSDDAIATVSADGLVTAQSVGIATITATSEGKSGSSVVTVTPAPPPPVASVRVSPSDTTVAEGGDVQFAAVLADADGNVLTDRRVEWDTSDHGIARVNDAGLVHARKAGGASITATSEGKRGVAMLTVVKK
jgi:uncharacterized protein YjdB